MKHSFGVKFGINFLFVNFGLRLYFDKYKLEKVHCAVFKLMLELCCLFCL